MTDAARYSRIYTVNTPDANTDVERMIRESRRATIDEMTGELKINHGSAHSVREGLEYRKVSDKWVHKQLTTDLKECHGDACETL